MKAIIRVPTVQYGYIEVEVEVGSQAEAVQLHNDMIAVYKASVPEEQLKDGNEKW